jgi:hypothetical protein
MKLWMAFVGLGLAAQPAVMVATPPTVEELAIIGASDEAKLDMLGIRREGDDVRFDVAVTRRDPAQSAKGEPASREVRYLGRCNDKALALSSVTTSDEYGKPIKRYLVPPGSAEFSRPPAGSQQAEWIEQACGRE